MSRPPHAGMLTLLMAFIVVIATWVGNVVIAYARAFPYLSGPRLPVACTVLLRLVFSRHPFSWFLPHYL